MGLGAALACSKSRLMRSSASTAQSLSQRTSMIESDEVMSVFTHSGPISACYEGREADSGNRQKSTVDSLSGAGQVPDPEDCGG